MRSIKRMFRRCPLPGLIYTRACVCVLLQAESAISHSLRSLRQFPCFLWSASESLLRSYDLRLRRFSLCVYWDCAFGAESRTSRQFICPFVELWLWIGFKTNFISIDRSIFRVIALLWFLHLDRAQVAVKCALLCQSQLIPDTSWVRKQKCVCVHAIMRWRAWQEHPLVSFNVF